MSLVQTLIGITVSESVDKRQDRFDCGGAICLAYFLIHSVGKPQLEYVPRTKSDYLIIQGVLGAANLYILYHMLAHVKKIFDEVLFSQI